MHGSDTATWPLHTIFRSLPARGFNHCVIGSTFRRQECKEWLWALFPPHQSRPGIPFSRTSLKASSSYRPLFHITLFVPPLQINLPRGHPFFLRPSVTKVFRPRQDGVAPKIDKTGGNVQYLRYSPSFLLQSTKTRGDSDHHRVPNIQVGGCGRHNFSFH